MDFETARKEIGLLDSILTRKLWNAALSVAAAIAEEKTYRQGRDRDLYPCEIEQAIEEQKITEEKPPYLEPDYIGSAG